MYQRLFLKPTAFFLILVMGSGCAIGPNFKKPKVSSAEQWKWQQAMEQTQKTQKKYARWWEVFEDPVLNSLEEKVLERNQDLRAAIGNVLEARANARITAADFYPQISAVPSANWSQTSPQVETGAPFKISRHTIDDYHAPLDISYEVDLWGKVRRHFESSRALALASEEEFQALLLSLTAETAQNYFLLRVFDKDDEILAKTIDLRTDSLNVNTSRYEAGLISAIDVARAQVELSIAQADLADSIRQRRQIENALAILTGTMPEAFSVSDEPLDSGLTPPKIPPGLPSDILKRRPDVAEAEAQLRSENAQIGVAIANFFPALRLTGTAGFESSDLANLFTWNSRTWSFGPSITIPIFEGGRNIANYKASKARHDTAFARYQQHVLVAFREVEDALVELRQRYQQGQALRAAVETEHEVVDLAHVRYRNGLTNYLEVIDAERTLLQAQRNANQVVGKRLLATVFLIKALGGGWE